jgi:hypothetical protein
MPNRKVVDSIFVSVASFRDAELTNTIYSLLSQAKDLNKIHVCIFSQDEDNNHPKLENLFDLFGVSDYTYKKINYKDSRGVGYARNYIQDFISNKNWIFGLLGEESNELFKSTIKKFLTAFLFNRINYNNIHFLTNKEAEMIKMFRNCYLSTKVSFCNEIYEYCQHTGVNYQNIITLASSDDRIGTSHSVVPVHDGKR